MNRKVLFFLIALAVSLAGCGRSGDVPEEPEIEPSNCHLDGYTDFEKDLRGESYVCDCENTPAGKSSWELSSRPGLWDYPIKQNTEEWEQFQGSYEEMVQLLQIPENILSSLSTEDLTDICLRYPQNAYAMIYQNINYGFDRLISEFNGYTELYNRNDVEVYLLKKYLEYIHCYSCLDGEYPNLLKGRISLNVMHLEGLIGRLGTKGDECLKNVLKALVAGYKIKSPYDEKTSYIIYNYFARWNIIEKMGVELDINISYLFRDQADRDKINELSYKLIQ